MAYITTQDFIDLFGNNEYDQLCDKEQDSDPHTSGFDISESAAADLVDSALSIRYVVPLSTVDGIVKEIMLDITRYFWHDDAPTKTIIMRYQDAIERLELIKKGKLTLDAELLPIADGELPAGATISKGSPLIFTDSVLSARP